MENQSMNMSMNQEVSSPERGANKFHKREQSTNDVQVLAELETAINADQVKLNASDEKKKQAPSIEILTSQVKAEDSKTDQK